MELGFETPGPDDAEALVNHLVRTGTVVRAPIVTEVRQGHRPAVSGRTIERRFRAAAGLTQGAVRQKDRKRLGSYRSARPSSDRCRAVGNWHG